MLCRFESTEINTNMDMANLDDLECALVMVKNCTNVEETEAAFYATQCARATGYMYIEAALSQAFWSSQEGRYCEKTCLHGPDGLRSSR